jgi:hypothetical protein
VTSFGLDDSEARAVADTFGVAIEQVRRDHLISHILAALTASHRDQVMFFGGTALARTYLPAGRLSEDVDLIATGARRETAAAIEQTLERALRRSHGRISWAPPLTAVRDTDAAVLLANDRQLAVRVQLLDHLGYPPWPTAHVRILPGAPSCRPRFRGCSHSELRFMIAKTRRGTQRVHPPEEHSCFQLLARRLTATSGACSVLRAHHAHDLHGHVNR